ncbi:putative flavonol 3-O-glucosyltransferase [Helianthus anomalus]
MYEYINTRCKYVRNIVAGMVNQPGSSRVFAFVVDVFYTCMINVANQFIIPTYYTYNSAYIVFNLYSETLCVDQNQDVIELRLKR